MQEELRTARSLELAAARLFATLAAPGMPGVSARLHAELGIGYGGTSSFPSRLCRRKPP